MQARRRSAYIYAKYVVRCRPPAETVTLPPLTKRRTPWTRRRSTRGGRHGETVDLRPQ